MKPPSVTNIFENTRDLIIFDDGKGDQNEWWLRLDRLADNTVEVTGYCEAILDQEAIAALCEWLEGHHG